MDFIKSYDVTFLSFFMLVAILLYMYDRKEIHNYRSRVFVGIIITGMLMLGLEMFSRLFDGIDGSIYYYLNWITNFLFRASTTIIIMLWGIYIDYSLFNSKERLKKRWYYIQPVLFVVGLSIINLFYPFIFTITENNHVTVLPYAFITFIPVLIMYAYVLVMLIQMRKSINFEFFFGVMMFLLVAILAKLMQVAWFENMLVWPPTAVSIFFGYLIFETKSSSIDFLTGAYTRMRAEYEMNALISKRKPFTILYIDADDFKTINDNYGHSIGDVVLVKIVLTLKQVFPKNAIISRYGGDEFLVALEGVDPEVIPKYRAEIKRFCEESDFEFVHNLNLSIGVEYWDPETNLDLQSVISNADNSMYLDKAKNKNYKRRKTDR